MVLFNTISFLLLAVFAGVLGSQAFTIQGVARIYPSVLIVLVLFGAIFMAARNTLKSAPFAAPGGDIGKLLSTVASERNRLFAFIALWLTYPWIMIKLGFIVATTACLFISLWLLQQKRPIVLLIGSAVFSLVFAVLFSTVFFIPVPGGFVDDWLTRMIFDLTR